MDLLEEMKDLRRTVEKQGERLERHSGRLTAIEKRTSEDHETLKVVKRDVDEVKSQITKMEKDVKAIRMQSDLTNGNISKLTKWMKVCLAFAVAAFCYSIFRNENTASAIATLTATIAKLVV